MTPYVRWLAGCLLAFTCSWLPALAAEPGAQRPVIDGMLQSLAAAMTAGDAPAALTYYDVRNVALAASVARDVRILRERTELQVSLRLTQLENTGGATQAVVLRTIRHVEHQRPQAERRWLTLLLQRTPAGWRITSEAERDYARTTYNDLSVELLPEQGRLRGQARLSLAILRGGTDRVLLELNRGLDITRVVDERGQLLRFERIGTSIAAAQPPSWRAGEEHALEVSFAGSLFNERQERGYSQAAIAPGGSFASWVTKWYPRLAGNGSKSPGRLRYRVPAGMTVASNGRLDGVTSQAGSESHVFIVERPLDFSFAAARYLHRTVQVDGIELGVYLLRGGESKVALYLREAARVLHAQRTLHGFYPFDGYALVEIPAEATGALGGSSEQGMNLFPVGTLPDHSFPLPLVAHEMGHSWWGNLVKSDEGVMLDEGLAQLTAALCVQALDGEAAMRRFMRHGYPGFPQSAGSYFARFAGEHDYALGLPPATPEAAAALHDIADTKGMLVFSMLRDAIGPDALLRGLRALARDFANESLTLLDLRSAWQKASGRDLQAFFQQWFFRTGAPELVLTAATHTTEQGFVTRGTVLQAGEAYELDIEIVLANEQSRTIHVLHLEEGVTAFSFTSSSKPDWVVLDPEYKVLRWTPELRHARLLDEGRVLLSLGRETAAVAKLEEYLRRAPDSLAGHAQLGIALLTHSQSARAEQHFQHVLDYYHDMQVFEPAVAVSLLQLGHVFDLTGRRTAALAAYEQVLAWPEAFDSHPAARAAREVPYVLPVRGEPPSRATLLRFAGDYDNGQGIAVRVRLNEQDVLQMSPLQAEIGARGTSLEWIDAARFRPPGSSSTLVEFSGEPGSEMLTLSVGDSVLRLARRR